MPRFKKLENRTYGFEFSGTEYTIIFKEDDIGFVRYEGRSKQRFYLDPHPLMPTLKKEIYIYVDGEMPPEGKLISVDVRETDSTISGTFGNYKEKKLKYVYGWAEINPNKVIKRKVLYSDEYIKFFKMPVNRSEDNLNIIDELGTCMGMYTASSHITGDYNKGGINTAINANIKRWDTFRRFINIIPDELRKVQSTHYYHQTKEDKKINPANSKEISIAYKNPDSVYVQMPITFLTAMRNAKDYKDDYEYLGPMVRAHILDMIMFKPDISSKMLKFLTDETYYMSEKVNSTVSFCKQDIGSTALKLSTSMARMDLSSKVTPEHIEESIHTWERMFTVASMQIHSNIDFRQQAILSNNARHLYHTLEDTFGIENDIPKKDAMDLSGMFEWDFEKAIEELRHHAAILCPNNYLIKLLDLKTKAIDSSVKNRFKKKTRADLW